LIGIIIQARMGSTRLPGKVLMKLGDTPLLEYIIKRLKKFENYYQIIIATTILKQDDEIETFCKNHNILYYRGSEKNVLERYYICAKNYKLKHIVRLTADNPFVDEEEMNNLIKLHLKTNADYSRSFSNLPKGIGSEIFTFESLEKSYKYGYKANHLEHVNEYIEENESLFKISELETINEKNCPHISLTVDTEDDYRKACYIVKNSKDKYITTQEAIRLCLQYV
jgi:spore coat polysaccharide biosynthesis protein SpsF